MSICGVILEWSFIQGMLLIDYEDNPNSELKVYLIMKNKHGHFKLKKIGEKSYKENKNWKFVRN